MSNKSFFLKQMVCLAGWILHIQKTWSRLAGKHQLQSILNQGANCHFEGHGIIYEPEKIKLGDHVFIGRNFFLRGKGGITIGSYTHISRNVTIHTVNHNVTGSLLPYDRSDLAKAIKIGSYVWIGMNSAILPGISIGDGAIIGMGTIVSKDVPPGAIIVGPSNRQVGARDDKYTKSLVEQQAFLKISR